jgi:hypothetical protein
MAVAPFSGSKSGSVAAPRWFFDTVIRNRFDSPFFTSIISGTRRPTGDQRPTAV